MSTIVYTGPSLSHEQAKAILPDAFYHEPIQCGDIIKAMRLGVKKIVIIDGYFEQRGAVWHKEILFALSHGVIVYGASSMGALRAAECHSIGMIGFGDIFEQYRDNLILDDDEVALVHADDYNSIITPMVNIRATLDYALEVGRITPKQKENLTQQLKHRPYYSRSLFNVSQDSELNHWFKTNYIDQKKQDAVGLLSALRDNKLNAHTLPEFAHSIFFNKILREKLVEPFDKDYDWLPEHEQATAKQAKSTLFKNRLRIAKLCHLGIDIAAKRGASIKADETLAYLSKLSEKAPISQTEMLQHLNIENITQTNEHKNDIEMSILATMLRGLIAYMDMHNLLISARFAQRYADDFRRARKLTTVEATFNWMKANNLKDSSDFERLINALSPLHHIVDLHNSHSIGLNTNCHCIDWLSIANSLIMTVNQSHKVT